MMTGRKWLKTKLYCDQPIVSETMRCVSDDFIKTIDDQGQNARFFYVWGKLSGRQPDSRETEKDNVREIKCAEVKNSVGERSRHSHINGQKRNMIIRMFAVKRWMFESDKLQIVCYGFRQWGTFQIWLQSRRSMITMKVAIFLW